LQYTNLYQLLVMVVLSARDADRHINSIAPKLFQKVPDMKALSKVTHRTLSVLIRGVRGFEAKADWLSKIGRLVKNDEKIPLSLEELTKLPGIGRKSANVILRESGRPSEGVVVDLHVVRVAPRLGIASGTDPKKIEKQIMGALPQKQWDAGMAMSFLGREVCRPKNPKCIICVMNNTCSYYKKIKSNKTKS
jgi:endonuclease-3